MQWNVPLADVQLGVEEILAVEEVLRSGWLTMGEVTEAFEREYAAFCGAKHALAVTNATVGLHLACVAVGLKPGDEMIVPSLTFVASANAICYTGALPVFTDIESEDWLCISPETIERAITPRTRGIMVMHYAGYACDMPVILDIAHRHNLAVVEDAAHAVGASLDGHALGTWGDVGVFSFFGNKNMTTGEGGMVVTNDDALAAKIRILRSHGMTTLTWDRHQGHASSYDVVDFGFNYRIDEMRSALGREQLKKLPAGNARRAELVALYIKLLSDGVPDVRVPFREPRGVSSYHIMPVLLPDGCDKLMVMERMKAQQIQTSWHYPPVHTFTAFRNGPDWSDRLLVTEAVARREITLPLYPTMRNEQVEMVVGALAMSLHV